MYGSYVFLQIGTVAFLPFLTNYGLVLVAIKTNGIIKDKGRGEVTNISYSNSFLNHLI